MIPRIGARGHSFQGAGAYFLHDKEKDTAERVAWTYTHNMPTQDPELAMKIMAYTAINRNKLKQEAGVPLTGRKGLNKPVYTFSLAWAPEQNPDDNHMRNKALDALELLGLQNHEAVFVAHNETAHPHVHGIVNLVNPENGKTQRPKNDRLKLSTWAEEYEKEHGKVFCEQRVINNERRRGNEKVKHRSNKVEQAALIQNLYSKAPDSQAFQKALESKGYTLASGDRRGLVLVDEQGKISSLSRQLKGQRAKDIKERLADLDDLPLAQTLSEDRQYFHRDQYETEQLKKIVDTAIETEEKRQQAGITKTIKPDPKTVGYKSKPIDQSFAEQSDTVREKSGHQHRAYLRKEQQLRDFYKREEVQKKLDILSAKIKTVQTSTRKTELQKQRDQLAKNIADIDQRMTEQNIDPIAPATRDFSKNEMMEKQGPDKNKPTDALQDTEKSGERKREELRQQIKDSKKDRGQDFGLDR